MPDPRSRTPSASRPASPPEASPESIRRFVVVMLFFLSGVAGLLYQVVWVHLFGLSFGNTIHSASIVTGVFMAGLGIGGLGGGALVDRAFRNDRWSGLRLYVIAEAAIGVLGVTLALILPRLESLSARISSYQIAASGWHVLTTPSYLYRGVVAVALLAPITILMGASLTFLIRALVQNDLPVAGWRIGWLYGSNTAGAALGSLLADSVWIPALGVASTQGLAAGLNLTAAVGGLFVLRSARAEQGPPGALATPNDTPSIGSRKKKRQAPIDRPSPVMSLFAPLAAVFLTGAGAMGLEILWFRFLTSALGQYRQVFSLLLFVILSGIGLGSVVGGSLSRRTVTPRASFIAAQVLLVLSTLLSFFLFDLDSIQGVVRDWLARSAGDLDKFSEIVIHLWAIVQIAGVPSFFMGFSYPLANAMGQAHEGRVGLSAGALYLGNTIGALFGSLLTGFYLLPHCGMKWTTLALVALALGALVPLALAGPGRHSARSLSRPLKVALPVGLLASLLMLVAWARTPEDYLVLKSFRASGRGSVRSYVDAHRVKAVSEGLIETAVKIDLPDRGMTLFTNGHIMSLTGYSAQRYMRAFVHVPLLHLEQPDSVLVICFGVGNTANAASLYPSVKRIDVVDISENILRQAPLFAATNGRVLADPRVSVFINDGRQHLRMQPAGSYDLVTLEPPPLSFAGVGALYSREFYELVRSRLKQGGFLTQWLPMRQVPATTLAAMIRAFVEVYPESLLLNGYMGDFLLVGRRDAPIEISPDEIRTRLEANPAVRADLARYDLASPVEILGMYAADGPRLSAAVEGTRALSDDLPLMEYGPIYRKRTDLPIGLIDVGGVRRWCPGCFEGQTPVPEVSDLPSYLAVMAHIYGRYASPSDDRPRASPALPEGWSISAQVGIELATRYGYLRRIVGSRESQEQAVISPGI